MAYLMFAFICVVWGASFILMKKAAVHFSPVSIAGWRSIGGAGALMVLCLWRTRRWPLAWKDSWVVGFAAVFGFAWPYSVQPLLVSRHGSAFVGMSVSFTPLFTILASVVLLKVYPTQRQTIGVLGALVCLGLLMADGVRRSIPVLDLAGALTVPLGYAVTNTLMRRRMSHVPSLELSTVCLGLASGLLVPMMLTTPSPATNGGEGYWTAIWSLGFLGVVGTGIAIFLFNYLVLHHGPLFAGMVTNLVPVGAVAWGWLDQERVTGLQLVALLGLITMVTITQYGAAGRAKEPIVEPVAD